MKHHLPTLAFVGFCVLFAPATAVGRPQSAGQGGTQSRTDSPAAFLDNPDIPVKMLDLMRASQARYLEGSTLIKAGESAKARIAFDEAVDLILQSEWNLPATPVLNSYFQDLIRSIQRDESRYLRADEIVEQKPERAVLDELEKVDLIPIQVDPAFRDVVEADILNTKYDIPVIVNESVYKAMNFWLSKGRKYFIDGITRSGRYQGMIERIFREESIPLDLMYLAQVESLFKTNALSRALAMGIWQFTKGTAVRYGLKVNRSIDERSDPEKSTRAAARYLNDLYAMFKDWNLVLAAYNWGEGAVQSLIDRSGVTDFWRLAEMKRKMPAETKNHVPLIIASVILARNPEKYGLPLELEAPLDYDRMPVTKRVSLNAAAKALEVSVDDLKRLNPALKTSYTPADYPDFVLNVPAGTGTDFAAKLASLPPADLKGDPNFNGRYKVQPGDTLSGISARFGVAVEDLQAANSLSSPQLLRAGAWLLVPNNSDRSGSRSTASAAGAGFSGRHQIKEGETLGLIAQRYLTSAAELQIANNLASANSIMPGAWLKVPVVAMPAARPAAVPATKAASSNARTDSTRSHQVRAGETLSSIAARYGVTPVDLQKANGIRSPLSLQIGTWLQIPAKGGSPPERPAIARK